MDESSPPIGSKGSYNIDWDNFDDTIDPFATKPKVFVDFKSPQCTTNATESLQNKANLALSPPDKPEDTDGKPMGDHSNDAHLQQENNLLFKTVDNSDSQDKTDETESREDGEHLVNELLSGDLLRNKGTMIAMELHLTDKPADIKKFDVGQQEVDAVIQPTVGNDVGIEESTVDMDVPVVVKVSILGEEEPEVCNKEPILGNENESVLDNKGSDISTEQAFSNEEPIRRNDELIDGKSEPILSNDELIVGKGESIQSNDELIVGKGELILGNNELIHGSEEPILDNEEPVFDNVAPTFGNKEPIIGKEEPILDDEPTVCNKEPILGNDEPIQCNKEPILSNEEPIFVNEEPTVYNKEPILGKEELILSNMTPNLVCDETILDNEERAACVEKLKAQNSDKQWANEPLSDDLKAPTPIDQTITKSVDFQVDPIANEEKVEWSMSSNCNFAGDTGNIINNNNEEESKPPTKKNIKKPSNSKLQSRLKLQGRLPTPATRNNHPEDSDDIQIFIHCKKVPEKDVMASDSGPVEVLFNSDSGVRCDGSGDHTTDSGEHTAVSDSTTEGLNNRHGGDPKVNPTAWTEDDQLMDEPTEDEFRPATEFFNDPVSWDLLEKCGGNLSSASLLARQSLYVKFDPLVKGNRSPGLQQLCKKTGPAFTPIKEQLSDDLILISTTPTISRDLAAATPQHKSVADLQDVDKMLACSPAGLATPSSKAQDGHSAEILSNGTGGDIVQVLKFSQSDITRMKKEWEMVTQGQLLAIEKDYQAQINELTGEKQKVAEQLEKERNTVDEMRTIMSEYEKTITQLIAEKEHATSHSKDSITEIIKERDQALEDLQSVENAFSDLHRRYEKSKQTVEGFKKNEEILKKCVTDYQSKLKVQEERYQALKAHAEEKLQAANQEIEKLNKSNEQEVTRLSAALKRAEMKNSSMEQSIEQKEKENQELVAFCDELIAKVGSGAQ